MSQPEPHLRHPAVAACSSAELRARVLEQARREPAPTRVELTAQNGVVMGAAMLIPLLVFFLAGGVRSAPRPNRLVLETAVGSALLAVGFAAVGLGRGRSMLGRARARLLTVVLGAPVLLFAWRELVSARYPNMMVEWTERPGLRCFCLSLALSMAPLVGALWTRWETDPVHPRVTAAVLAAIVGAGAWVLVDLWCPVGYVPHVLFGHVTPLILLMAGSALFGGRLLALRARAKNSLDVGPPDRRPLGMQ